MSYSQLCTENAMKAIITCFGTPNWTHNPKNELETIIKSNLQPITANVGKRMIDQLKEA